MGKEELRKKHTQCKRGKRKRKVSDEFRRIQHIKSLEIIMTKIK